MTAAILFARPRAALADDRFELDAYAAEELDIESWAIPLEPIVDGDPERALAHRPRPRGRTWIYRGWMLSEEEYAALYDAIGARGETMLVDPESFADAMYAPRYLPRLGDHTAPARWTDDEDIDVAWELACELGPPPWIVKDHVKSAKEEWWRACFVPESAGRDEFRATCERLLELRGDRFERGFVIKKYLELATLRGMTPERRPVTDEHRLVFAFGRLVAHAPYYDADDAALEDPARFAFIGDAISSPFFTADVARLRDGGWTIIEINDGGCSNFPDQLDPRDVFRALTAPSNPPTRQSRGARYRLA
jgi:hypothetical protein